MVLICYLASIAVLIRTKCDLFQCFHWAQAMLDLDGELPSAFPCFIFPNASVGRVRNLSWMQTVICRRKMLPFYPGKPWGTLHFLFFFRKTYWIFLQLELLRQKNVKKQTQNTMKMVIRWLQNLFLVFFSWKYYWSTSEGEVLELAVLGCPQGCWGSPFISNTDTHKEIVCVSLLLSHSLVSLLVLSWEYF